MRNGDDSTATALQECDWSADVDTEGRIQRDQHSTSGSWPSALESEEMHISAHRIS
jgi:hypothetical protein